MIACEAFLFVSFICRNKLLLLEHTPLTFKRARGVDSIALYTFLFIILNIFATIISCFTYPSTNENNALVAAWVSRKLPAPVVEKVMRKYFFLFFKKVVILLVLFMKNCS